MIELVTLGRSSVLRDRVDVPVSPRSSGFLLLVHLAVVGPRSEAEVAKLLWPDESPEGGRRRLAATVDDLRERLGPGVIRAAGDMLAVDAGLVSIDVVRFREALVGGRPGDASAIYQGPFLDDLDPPDSPVLARWIEETRRALAEEARRIPDQGAEDLEPAKEFWPRVIRELRSRRTVHVALLYLGFAWGSLEVCSTLVQMELLGNPVFVGLLAFHFVGFPLVIAGVWLLEKRKTGPEAASLPGALGRRGARVAHVALVLAVLAAGSGVGWLVLRWGAEGVLPPASLRAELPVEQHIAVLPFHVSGPGLPGEDFADGLMETLTAHLTQVEGLKGSLSVVPSAEVRSRGVRGPGEAWESFGANLAITGSIQGAVDSLQVTVNLVDAVRVRHLGSFRLAEAGADRARFQDEILSGLGTLLQLDLETTDRETLASGGTESSQAYTLQMRARGHLQRYEREESLERALLLFTEALELDSRYVLALAGLGQTYKRLYDLNRDPRNLERGREMVEQALTLDDRNASAHVTLGMIQAATGGHDEAVDSFRRALALEPYSVEALLGLGEAYSRLGRSADAERSFLRAIEVRPAHWSSHNSLGRLYYTQGRYEEAAEQYSIVVEIVPDHLWGWSNLGAAYAALGRIDEAVDAFERSRALGPDYGTLQNLATLHAWEGRYREAAAIFEEALALDDGDFRVWYNLGATYYNLSEREQARTAFERARDLARSAFELNRHDPEVMVNLAGSHAHLGEHDRARALIRQTLEIAPEDIRILARAASIHEIIGDRIEALRLTHEALRRGYPLSAIQSAPEMADLLADPRFRVPGAEVEDRDGDDVEEREGPEDRDGN